MADTVYEVLLRKASDNLETAVRRLVHDVGVENLRQSVFTGGSFSEARAGGALDTLVDLYLDGTPRQRARELLVEMARKIAEGAL